MNRRRIVALLALLLPIVLIGMGVLALDAERVGALAAARAETALDRDVGIARARVRLFPVPAVALEEVTVGGPRAAAGAEPAPTLAAVRRVELRPRLLPLLRGEVVINSVVLDGPTAAVAVDADGASNLPTFEPAGDEAEGGVLFEIRRVTVRDGLLGYDDARDGTVVRLRGVEQQLTLRADGDAVGAALLRLDGALRVAAVDAALPGRLARPLRDVRVEVSHRASWDRSVDRLEVGRLRATVQEVVLNGEGVVAALTDADAREVDLRLSTGRFDVGRLLRSLPEAARRLPGAADGAPLTASGRAALDLQVAGRVGGGTTPDVRGALTLDGVSLARRGNGRLADGVRGDVRFTLSSLESGAVTGRVLEQPVQLGFAVRDFAAPTGHVAVRTGIDLGIAARRGLLPEGWSAAGVAAVDARADGPLLDAERLRLSGRVGLDGVRVGAPALLTPLEVRSAELRLQGQELRTSGARLAFGESDVTLDATLREWIPALVRDVAPAPLLAFDARSRRFDVDEVLGYQPGEVGYAELFLARLQDAPVGGASAADAAEAAGLGLPDLPAGVRFQGRVRAAEAVRAGVVFAGVDAELAAQGGPIDLRSARFATAPEGMWLDVRVGAAADVAATDGALPASVAFRVEDPGTGDFVGRFDALRGHLTGSLALRGTAHMQLDRHLLPVRETLAGEGSFDLVGGRLVNWPIARVLGRQLGIAQFDVLPVEAGTGRFRIEGPWITLDRWSVDLRDVVVQAAGRFDMAGRLDLRTTVELSPAFAGLARGTPLATLAQGLGGGSGWIPVGSWIGGTAADPTVRLDLSAAQGNLAAHTRERLEEEIREQARRLAGRAAPPAPADSAAAPGGAAGDEVGPAAPPVADREPPAGPAPLDRLRRVLRGAGRAE